MPFNIDKRVLLVGDSWNPGDIAGGERWKGGMTGSGPGRNGNVCGGCDAVNVEGLLNGGMGG